MISAFNAGQPPAIAAIFSRQALCLAQPAILHIDCAEEPFSARYYSRAGRRCYAIRLAEGRMFRFAGCADFLFGWRYGWPQSRSRHCTYFMSRLQPPFLPTAVYFTTAAGKCDTPRRFAIYGFHEKSQPAVAADFSWCYFHTFHFKEGIYFTYDISILRPRYQPAHVIAGKKLRVRTTLLLFLSVMISLLEPLSLLLPHRLYAEHFAADTVADTTYEPIARYWIADTSLRCRRQYRDASLALSRCQPVDNEWNAERIAGFHVKASHQPSGQPRASREATADARLI